MNKTREEKKIKAIELMKKLDIYKPYIKGFKNEDTVCYFENYGGYWAWQEPDLMKKVIELEEEYNCLVYAITHEYTAIGEMYSFLIVDAALFTFFLQDSQSLKRDVEYVATERKKNI